MRVYAIAITLVLFLSYFSGCLGENIVDIEEDPTDPNPIGFVGFTDNSSVDGFRINGTTLEKIWIITEAACNAMIAQSNANTDAESNVHWDSISSICFSQYAFEEAAHPNLQNVYNLTAEDVCFFKGLAQEYCFPIKVSGRVMWFDAYGSSIMSSDGMASGASPGHCGIYIQSERLTLPGPIVLGDNAMNASSNTWNESILDLMEDQQYIDWDLERMNAYSQEAANAPSWCTQPVYSELWWMMQPQNGNSNDLSSQYIGFLDNSTTYGWRISPIENFSRIYIAQNENNCTSTQDGDDWNGTWEGLFCVKNLRTSYSLNQVTHQNGELCFEDASDTWCHNMTVSNRVMWLQGDLWGGQDEQCTVTVQMPTFIQSSTYNLSLNSYDDEGEYIYPDWDALVADPAYTAWNDEWMATYNSELSSAPAWCTEPIFGPIGIDDLDEGNGGSTGEIAMFQFNNTVDHVDAVTPNTNDKLFSINLSLVRGMELDWNEIIFTIVEEDSNGNVINEYICSNPGQTGNVCSIEETLGNGDNLLELGEELLFKENGTDICTDTNACYDDESEYKLIVYRSLTNKNDNQPGAIKYLSIQ